MTILLALLGGVTKGVEHGAPGAVTTRPEALRIAAVTSPSESATLASVVPARIARLPALEAAPVTKGDLVVVLDDAVARARTELAKAAAESTLEIDLTRARYERAKREWERLQKLRGGANATSKEMSDAQADFQVSEAEHELAKFRHLQARRTYERERASLDEFHVTSPLSGYVAQHHKHVGETVDQLEGIVTVVQIDPLLVVVDCPVALAPFVKQNDRVRVEPVDPRWWPRVGTVVMASPIADAASQTFRVKLHVANDDRGWMSGLKVVVDFGSGELLESDTARGRDGNAAPRAVRVRDALAPSKTVRPGGSNEP